MRLVVGLGNPGAEYARTRHNAGFMALDVLARRHAPAEIPRQKFRGLLVESRFEGGGGGDRVLLLKPMTYMNRSGEAVAEAIRFYKLDPSSDLMVLVDDVSLDCGRIRLRAGGSAGGHNGLTDVERALGTDGYARCRIGIDAPGPAAQVGHVLGKFSPEQLEAVEESIERAADATEEWVSSGIDAAMNKFNVRPERRREDADRGEDRSEESRSGHGATAGPSPGDSSQ